jgi:hypothetical protein
VEVEEVEEVAAVAEVAEVVVSHHLTKHQIQTYYRV